MRLPALFQISGLVLALATLVSACAPPADRSPDEIRSDIHQMYDSYRKEFPTVRGITADELAEFQTNAPVILVDVREPGERAVSMIPGAITREQFEAEKATIGDRPVVAYCTIGYRSGQYVAELNKQGIPARNLEGSILAWVNAGRPVVDSSGAPTKRVHTYGRQWALLPEGYEAVY